MILQIDNVHPLRTEVEKEFLSARTFFAVRSVHCL